MVYQLTVRTGLGKGDTEGNRVAATLPTLERASFPDSCQAVQPRLTVILANNS